ncbi:choice-of-anchor D domain-containing protein [bacterium]|nr:choice-of-anchor D domain-containing protein [bacterium]
MKRFLLISIFFLICCSKGYSQYWEKVTNIPAPYNAGYYLDLWILPSDPNYIWACGFDGFIIRSTNNGSTWLGSQLPYPAYHIESIQFINKFVGYASGVEGIFKSTDGGATFFDITPSALEDYWGCYFLNENVGVLLGGGCDGVQRFYKTTNGGASWTFTVKTVPNSGLTDPILYPSGLGYAVSSGKIWQTLDSGSTWQVFSNCGSEIWQEEISIIGNSIVVPTAGTICEGQGDAGGMRFSTNMGTTWTEFLTGYPMFGACLVNQTEAWACGYNRSVYYTSNAGNSWQLRNCGIENVNLDDITFTSSTDGWVVGEGVYRYKPTEISAARDTINFGKLCIPEIALDSFRIKNHSVLPADLTLQKTLDFSNAFSIQKPNSQSQIASCDSSTVIIKFSPQGNGKFQALLLVDAQSGDGVTHFHKEIVLIGTGTTTTIRPEKDIIILNPVLCGDIITTSLNWVADSAGESLSSFNSLSPSNNQIKFISKLPLDVPITGATIQFQIQLIDTGWNSSVFKFYREPCSRDTNITIKAYGVSPIINSVDSLHLTIHCSGSIIDTIPIWNTGNNLLTISKTSFSQHDGDIQILGWTSNRQLPISIPVKSSDSLIIQYSPAKIGKEIIYLSIENNDRTLARGNKQPLSILLVCTLESEDISVKNMNIDLGDICLDSQSDTLISLINKGNITSNLSIIENCKPPFSLQVDQFDIEATRSGEIQLHFSPTKTGSFLDTLILQTGDCKKITLYLKGRGIDGALSIQPNSISDMITTNQSKTFSIKISNIGNIPLGIVNYSFNPPLSGFTADLQPILTQNIDTTQSITFDLIITANQAGSYSGEICFEADGICPTSICIPVELTSVARSITTDQSIDFGKIYCDGLLYDTLWIRNKGTIPDTVTQITISGESCFSIYQSPQIPAFINGNDSVGVIILFLPINEGDFSANLHIETIQPKGQIFDIPITGSFYRSVISSNTTLLDFGILEKCDEPITKQFTIYNNGMLDEILTAIQKDFGNYYSFDLLDNIPLPGKDSVIISITFHPDIAQNEGNYLGEVTWASSSCPDTIKIDFIAKIIEPKLSYSKFDINFGNVWKDEIKFDTIQVNNNSAVTRQIKMIQLPDNSDFQIVAMNNNVKVDFPISIRPNTSIELIVSFNASKVGDFGDNFIIEESSVCKDTLEFHLQSVVPNEQYYARIFIEDYEIPYDNILTFYVELSEDLPKVIADSIQFAIDFDKYLFYPMKLGVRDENLNSYNSIEYNYLNGRINASINYQQSQYLLNNKGKIIAITGLTLFSSPTITPLIISDFQVFTKKELYLTKEDGELKVLDICEPLARNKIIINNNISFIELPTQIIENQTLELIAHNLKDGSSISIYNSFGQKMIEQSLPKGNNTISINIKDFPSGIYFIVPNEGDLGYFQFINLK